MKKEEGQHFAPTLHDLTSEIWASWTVKGYLHIMFNVITNVTEYIASLLTPNVITCTSWHLVTLHGNLSKIHDNKMPLIWHWTWKVSIIGLFDTIA